MTGHPKKHSTRIPWTSRQGYSQHDHISAAIARGNEVIKARRTNGEAVIPQPTGGMAAILAAAAKRMRGIEAGEDPGPLNGDTNGRANGNGHLNGKLVNGNGNGRSHHTPSVVEVLKAGGEITLSTPAGATFANVLKVTLRLPPPPAVQALNSGQTIGWRVASYQMVLPKRFPTAAERREALRQERAQGWGKLVAHLNSSSPAAG